MKPIHWNLPEITRGALRAARRRPVTAAVVIILAALGTASFTSIFGLIDAVQFSSLPAYRPHQLIRLKWTSAALPSPAIMAPSPGYTYTAAPYYIYRAVEHHCSLCAALFGSEPLGIGPNKVRAYYHGHTYETTGEAVVGNYFSGLNLIPAQGRLFGQNNHLPSLVLSYRFWSELPKSGKTMLGTMIYMQDRAYTIVGVAPRGFHGVYEGRNEDFWVPARSWTDTQQQFANPAIWWIVTFARIKTGISKTAAEHEISRIANTTLLGFAGPKIQRIHIPKFSGVSGSQGLNLLAWLMPNYLPMLFAASCAGLILAWSGLMFLTLWVSVAEIPENVIRRALGATAADILLRMTFTAFAPIALGVTLGALGGWYVNQFLTQELAISLVRLGLIPPAASLDLHMVLMLGCLLLGSMIVGGIIPGLVAIKRSNNAAILSGASRMSRRTGPAITLTAIAQIAIAFALAFGCSALIGSAIKLLQVPLGFQPEHLIFLQAKAKVPGNLSPALSAMNQKHYIADSLSLLTRISSLPGVARASFATTTPFTDWAMPMPAIPENQHAPIISLVNLVGPGYFSAMKIHMVSGRSFSSSDINNGRAVAVVNRGFITRAASKPNKMIHSITMFGRRIPVAGICENAKYGTITGNTPAPRIYLPFSFLAGIAQNSPDGLVLAVRTIGSAPAVESELSHFIWPGWKFTNIRTGRDQIDNAIMEQLILARFSAVTEIFVFFLLGMVIYGFLTQMLLAQRKDFSIRMALGCRLKTLIAMTAWRMARLLLLGIALGLVLTWWESASLHAWLYGIGPADPWVMLAAILILLISSTGALLIAIYPLHHLELARLLDG